MSESEQYTRNMTAVRLIDSDGTDSVEVIFLESAQFYRLPRKNPEFDSLVAVLHDAIEKGAAVKVRTASIASDVIEDIGPAR
ncbi:MAG: hypothetical protein WBD27_04055 [Pyrinomonadaceae bacterium]